MSNFETWWEREGQEFLYALNTTTDDDIKLVAEVAWKNGAYCAEQAEQEPVASVRWGRYKECEWTATERLHELLGRYREGQTPLQLYAAPVRTKDLTDDEIEAIFEYWYSQPETEVWSTVDLARAVIAADREKNK